MRLTEILEEEGEAPQIADEVAGQTTDAIAAGLASPADFVAVSPSGGTYAFLVQKKETVCLLRLHYSRRNMTEVTNNITYIATRALPECACE